MVILIWSMSWTVSNVMSWRCLREWEWERWRARPSRYIKDISKREIWALRVNWNIEVEHLSYLPLDDEDLNVIVLRKALIKKVTFSHSVFIIFWVIFMDFPQMFLDFIVMGNIK